MAILELSFQSGETSLSVRRFSIHEAVSTLFTASVWARSENPAIDISAIVGQTAGFRIMSAYVNVLNIGSRVWSGICTYMEQTHAEHRGNKVQSTYYLRIVPVLYHLDQRRNYRIFQHLSAPDIIDKLLDEWGIKHIWKIDRGAVSEARVQGPVRRDRFPLHEPHPGGGGHRLCFPGRRGLELGHHVQRRAP